VAKHAFPQEDQFGDPLAQDQLGAMKQQPVTSESEAPRLAEEHEKKMFNRRKMGGFLMELGLNILSSNRDDAGEAVGQAFQTTTAARTERKRVSASEELAKQERERKIRREDESDILKQEKAERDVAKEERAARGEKRAVTKAELDKLDSYTREDGTVVKIAREEGTVYDVDGTPLVPRDAKKIISATSGAATTRDQARALRQRVKDLIDRAVEGFEGDPGFDEVQALGESPTQEQLENLAKQQLNREMPGYYNFKVKDGVQDYETLQY